MGAADGGAGIMIGGSGDGAGIQDDNSGGGWIGGALKAALLELTLDGSAVGLGGAATEIFDVKAEHGTILAYARLGMGEGIPTARGPNFIRA
jgi:hypothetical protein